MRPERKLTPLKRLERYVSAIFKLGRTEGMAKNAKKRVTEAEFRMDAIEHELESLGREQKYLQTYHEEQKESRRDEPPLEDLFANIRSEFKKELAETRADIFISTQSELALLGRIFSDLSRRIDLLSPPKTVQYEKTATQTCTIPHSNGFESFKELFYHRLENRYRGSVKDIKNRLCIYVPDIEAAYIRTGKKPVMDIGCGRGEWLDLLKGADIDAFGIDTNSVQIESAKEQGLDIRLGDALEALAQMEDNSLSALTAHHFIEHIPFESVAWITRESMRVLAPGGILMFETPHVRNLLVGATTFHTDPTHLKPMTEQVMTVLLETAGFDAIEVRSLNPHERLDEFLGKPDFNDELAFLMFGPQDLAILGTKPKGN